jgi:thiol-disulfide isomerase/thioredoxin
MYGRVHCPIELMSHWRRMVGGALVIACSLSGCYIGRERDVTLEPIRFEHWQEQLHSMKGRIVVLDVWATWCVPCVERLPHMVHLYRRYKDRGVEFVSMGVDDVEDKVAVERARQILRQQHATFRNYLMNENIMQSFEKLGVQGIPDVMLYDRAGRLRYDLNGNDPNHHATTKDVDDDLSALIAGR